MTPIAIAITIIIHEVFFPPPKLTPLGAGL